MDTPALRSELARALEITADRLAYLAAIWKELEARGEDLSHLRSGMAVYLPMIASNHLAAEAVVRFAGSKTMLRAVAQLPLDEQRRLAQGGKVSVHLDGADREVEADGMTTRMIKAAFADGRIRSLDEQRSIAAPVKSATTKLKRGEVRGVAGGIQVGRTRVSTGDVLTALRAFHDSEDIDDQSERKLVPIPLREDEHRALRIHSAKSGTPMATLARAAMRAAGLLNVDE